MIDRIKEPWGGRTPFGPGEEWPVRVDQFLEEGVSEDDVDRWVQTASILHSNGDALDIAVKDRRIVGVPAPPPTNTASGTDGSVPGTAGGGDAEVEERKES